jgi:hypothetical protein
VLGDRLGDFGVVDQAAHRIHAARELEGLDRAIETLVELRNRVFEAAAQIPADGGEQEMRREGHAREKQDQDKKPERQRHGRRHGRGRWQESARGTIALSPHSGAPPPSVGLTRRFACQDG